MVEKIHNAKKAVSDWWQRDKYFIADCAKSFVLGYGIGSLVVDITGLRNLGYKISEAKGYGEGYLQGQEDQARLQGIANGYDYTQD